MKNNSKKTDRIQEPPKLAIKVANTVFVLGGLYSVLTVIYAIYRTYNLPFENPYIQLELGTTNFFFIYILFGGISATLFGLGLRLSNGLKVNLSLLLITASMLVFAFESYLELSRKTQAKIIAEQFGVPYDTRTKMEILKDLNETGAEAYPNVLPAMFVKSNGLKTKNERIYPLGGISNITTILSMESGYYPIIETDEHGFNNSRGLYKENRVDIVLTGDSF